MNTEGKVTYKYIVYIQFEESKKAYTFGSNVKYYTNDIVVVETVRGQELGKVCVPTVDFDASKVKRYCVRQQQKILSVKKKM